MSLEPMWEALERYQPYAEKHGFGADWKRMTTERTVDAADDAAAQAWWAYAKEAALAAERASSATTSAEVAIAKITQAIELESKDTA